MPETCTYCNDTGFVPKGTWTGRAGVPNGPAERTICGCPAGDAIVRHLLDMAQQRGRMARAGVTTDTALKVYHYDLHTPTVDGLRSEVEELKRMVTRREEIVNLYRRALCTALLVTRGSESVEAQAAETFAAVAFRAYAGHPRATGNQILAARDIGREHFEAWEARGKPDAEKLAQDPPGLAADPPPEPGKYGAADPEVRTAIRSGSGAAVFALGCTCIPLSASEVGQCLCGGPRKALLAAQRLWGPRGTAFRRTSDGRTDGPPGLTPAVQPPLGAGPCVVGGVSPDGGGMLLACAGASWEEAFQCAVSAVQAQNPEAWR